MTKIETEADWLACTDPTPMLEFLRLGIIALVDTLPSETERQAMRKFLQGKTVPRKAVLFACGCCREIWDVIMDECSRKAIEVAEQAVDDIATEHEVNTATLEAHDARNAVEHKRGQDRAETHNGDDEMYGGALYGESVGNDTMDGGSGNDILNGQAGNDIMDGGDDHDTLNGDAGDDTVD